MNRTTIGCLLALACLMPFGYEKSATIHGGFASSTVAGETVIGYADGRFLNIERGGNHTVYEPVKVSYRMEIGWHDLPVNPEPHLVIRDLRAIRPEEFVAIVIFPPRRTIMLNFPPAASVWHLPAGIAQLTGVLKSEGHHVIQRYGHIGGVEHLLREHGGSQINRALKAVRDRTSDIHMLYEARMTFEHVSRSIATSDKFLVERNNVNYVSAYHDGTIDGALAAIENRDTNVFYDYFNEVEVPLAREIRPDVYGVNASDERQFIQSLVLAAMIKDALPECLVVLGGNYWTRVQHAFKLPGFEKFFDHCDAIVYREGYQPIQRLAETLNPGQASGVAWRRNGSVVVNPPTGKPTDFRLLPTPIFDSGQKQWAPDFVPSLYTASNCYMACEFCDIGAGSDTFLDTPRAMSPRQIAEHMHAIGATRFEITDEMLPIPRQIALGEELKRIGHAATWECYMTITNHLVDPRVCEQLYAAGCRAVQLGLESLSMATLAQEKKKWNTPASYGRVLANLKAAGIQTHAFIIVGIPGQSLHWDLAWTAFLEKYGENILTIKGGRYRLSRHSPEMTRGTRSAFIDVLPDLKPMHLNRDFRYRNTSRNKVEAMRDIVEEACRQHWGYRVTSTRPWWPMRGTCSWQQLAAESCQLPKEPSVRHLAEAMTRANTIAREELKLTGKLETLSDIASLTRVLI